MSEKKLYSEKLKDPRWQRRRLEILNNNSFQCEECNSKEKTLHVHHAHYFKDRDPWEYDNKYLMCLCSDCHKKRQKIEEDFHHQLSLIMKYFPTYLLHSLYDVIIAFDLVKFVREKYLKGIEEE